MVYTDLEELIDLSVNEDCQGDELPCSLSISVEGRELHVYCAYISHRDILLIGENGTANYLVDSYGDRHTIELYDWELETT